MQDFHSFLGTLGNFILGQLLQLQAKGNVFPHRHMREESVALENHGNIAFSRRQVVNLLPIHEQITAGNFFKAGNHAQCCGFATAGGSQ